MLDSAGRSLRIPSTRSCMRPWNFFVTAVPSRTSCSTQTLSVFVLRRAQAHMH